MGIPATGRKISFDVHERCRFVAGMFAERWAQLDFEEIRRKLTDPLPWGLLGGRTLTARPNLLWIDTPTQNVIHHLGILAIARCSTVTS